MPKENYPLIVPEDYVAHWKNDISNEAYHADKSAVSSTALRKILKSPWNFFYSHVLGQGDKETSEMRFGTAFHMALLERDLFEKKFILEPTFSGKGSVAAYNDWKQLQPLDAIILSQKEHDDLMGMIDSVSHHVEASSLLKGAVVEQSGYYRDPKTGILCRFRADFFHAGVTALGDVKTTMDCTTDAFSRTIFSHRYDIQLYMYCLGIEQITGNKVSFPMYLACEKKAPYDVALYTADDALLERGKLDYEIAMSTLKASLEADSWTRYQQQNQTISLPKYAFYE